MGHPQQAEYRQELANWLCGQKWDYFLTVTFKTPENRPDRAVQRVKRELESYPARSFIASECHEKGDYHVHGLFHYDRYLSPEIPHYDLSATTLWGALYSRFGRSRVEVVKSPLAVTLYCAKYVTKELSDYDVAGSPRHWQGKP